MKLLIIGGTSFLGRAAAEEALRRGDEVTTFNRGQTGPDVDGVEALRGDRDDEVALVQLKGREYDGVVDTCGFVPRVVGKATRALADNVGHYAYVSSISASSRWPAEVAHDDDEGAPCLSDAGPDDGDYGVLKAGCERAVREAFGDRSTIARAGLILGPHENVGRLTWWLSRMARGGEVLAPGDPELAMQLIDVRDLASYLLDSIVTRTSGTYNVSAPPGNVTMGSWLGDAARAAGTDTELTWVDDDFLLAQDVETWTELPLWSPTAGDAANVWNADTSGAARTGLGCRPVSETVADTWAWMLADGVAPDDEVGRFRGNGIDADKERRILADWHAA